MGNEFKKKKKENCFIYPSFRISKNEIRDSHLTMEPYHASAKALITAKEQYCSLLFTKKIHSRARSWRGWRPFSVLGYFQKLRFDQEKKNKKQKMKRKYLEILFHQLWSSLDCMEPCKSLIKAFSHESYSQFIQSFEHAKCSISS